MVNGVGSAQQSLSVVSEKREPGVVMAPGVGSNVVIMQWYHQVSLLNLTRSIRVLFRVTAIFYVLKDLRQFYG